MKTLVIVKQIEVRAVEVVRDLLSNVLSEQVESVE